MSFPLNSAQSMRYRVLSWTTCLLHTFQDKLRGIHGYWRSHCTEEDVGVSKRVKWPAQGSLSMHPLILWPEVLLPWPESLALSGHDLKFPGPHVCSLCSWKTPVLPPSVPPDAYQMFLLPQDFPRRLAVLWTHPLPTFPKVHTRVCPSNSSQPAQAVRMLQTAYLAFGELKNSDQYSQIERFYTKPLYI